MKKFRSLTTTITLTFISLGIVVLSLTVASGLYYDFQTQREVISNTQQSLAQDAANTVKNFIQVRLSNLDQAADVNDLASIPGRRVVAMDKIMGRNPSYTQMFLIDSTGKELHTVSRLSGTSTDPLPQFISPLLGKVMLGENYISEVYIDSTTNEPLVLLAVPARNMSKELAGALIAEVSLKFMWDLIGAVRIGATGIAYVVDREGDLIASGDSSRVSKKENLGVLREVHEFRTSGATDPNGYGEVSTGINGTTVVSSYVALGTPDWAVIIEEPVYEAYATFFRILSYGLLLLLGSIILAAIGVSYFARKITRGITRLSKNVEEISKGDLTVRTSITSNDEIGLLGMAFNTMNEKLQEMYGLMDKNIQEKTKELSEEVEAGKRNKLAILNLLEDIDSEKKEVEKTVVLRTHELSDEKARLLASINSLTFGFIIVDTNNNIMIKNPVLSMILETVDEPKTLSDVANYLKEIDLVSSCKECSLTGQIVGHKEVSYGKKYLKVSCSPIFEDQNVIGNVVLVEDITEAKVMERSRDEFFAVASHELRTPLTAIRGNADMILDMYADKIVDKDMKEMLTDINTSSIRLIAVVNDFLEVSRLEQGRIEIKKEKFDIAEVVAKVDRNLKEMISEKGLALLYTPPATPLPAVDADKDRVEQILVNLIGNAAKFTKEGSITITLAAAGNFVEVRVTDTGTGISEHNQALLFRKFQQAGEQMLARDVSQSTGLGLYISRLIISNMGGTIGLEKSELGKGSTFIFTVPVAAN